MLDIFSVSMCEFWSKNPNLLTSFSKNVLLSFHITLQNYIYTIFFAFNKSSFYFQFTAKCVWFWFFCFCNIWALFFFTVIKSSSRFQHRHINWIARISEKSLKKAYKLTWQVIKQVPYSYSYLCPTVTNICII